MPSVKKIILAHSLITSALVIVKPAFAEANKEPLTKEQLCNRLVVTEEVLVFDESGTKIKNIHREDRGNGDQAPSPFETPKKPDKSWHCASSGTSKYSSSDLSSPIVFTHKWTVKEDGTLEVSFEQGTDRDAGNSDSHIKGSLGKQMVAVKDFAPFIWVSPLHKSERVIVRLTPSLSQNTEKTTSIAELPIVLDDATIFDGKGRLWAANLSATNGFIGVTTVQGSFMISFREFPGGKKTGIASGNELRFKTEDGTSVVIKTSSPILPGHMRADVYVLVDSSRKASSISSQHVSSGDKPEETLKRFEAQKAK